MKNSFKRITGISLALALALTQFSVSAFAEETVNTSDTVVPAVPYVILAEGNDSSVQITSSTLQVSGNICSDNSISIECPNKIISGELDENTDKFSLSFMYSKIKEGSTVTHNEYVYNEALLDVENSIFSNSSINIFSEVTSLNETLDAVDSIYIDSNSVNSSNNAVLFAEDGNITIEAEDFIFSGVIYAPNGKITIESDHISFTGMIIANEVEISANTILLCDSNEIYTTFENYCNSIADRKDSIIVQYRDNSFKIKNALNSNCTTSELVSLYKKTIY